MLTLCAVGLLLAGCTKDKTEPTAPAVTAELSGEPGMTSLSVIFKPNETSTGFKYAIGSANDKAAFESGTMEGITEVTSAEEVTKEFTGLAEYTEYCVFAQSWNKNNEKSAVTTLEVKTATETPLITITKVGEPGMTYLEAAIEPSKSSENFRYAIGKAGDLDAFTAGTLNGIIKVEGNDAVIKRFTDLDPDTEYTIFAQSSRLSEEVLSEVGTLIIKTESTGEMSTDKPDVAIEFYNLNAITCDVGLIPNSLCSKYITVSASAELWDIFVLIYGDGDEVAAVQAFLSEGAALEASGNVTQRWALNGEPEYEHIFVVLPFDNEGNPASELIKKTLTAPDYVEDATPPSMTILVDEITVNSGRLTITLSDNSIGCFYNFYTAAEFDATSEEIMINNLSIFGTITLESTVTNIKDLLSGTEIVAAGVACNANGTLGYGPLASFRFTTPAAESSQYKLLAPNLNNPYKRSLDKSFLK